MCITWKKCNGTGAVVGTVTGFCSAITGWLACTAKLNDGIITVATTFQDYPMLTGNLLSIGVGGIITVVWSLLAPANFDWEFTRAINCQAQHTATTIEETGTPENEGDLTSPKGKDEEKNAQTPQVGEADVNAFSAALESRRMEEDKDMEGLRKAFRFAAISALTLTFILIILIPLPLFFSRHGMSSGPDWSMTVLISSLPRSRLYRLCSHFNYLALPRRIYGGYLSLVGG
jgi:hypothetical protein